MAALSENPSSVRVRKLDPWVIKTHAQLSKNAGISLEEHLRRVLTEKALQNQEEFADEIEQHRAAIEQKFGNEFPSAESLIRDVREES